MNMGRDMMATADKFLDQAVRDLGKLPKSALPEGSFGHETCAKCVPE